MGVAWMIAGTAGEGLESGGETFSRALAALGYRPTTQRDFPSRIRGGDTTFTVRLTKEGRLAPPAHIDLALAFNGTVVPRIATRMGQGSLLLLDEGVEAAADPKGPTDQARSRVVAFPFTALAAGVGLARAKNMVALGASASLLGIDVATLQESVSEQFAGKGEKVVAMNRAALLAGFREAESRFGAQPTFALPAPGTAPALFLSGNEAVALAALASGCRIAAAYPITPASDILEYLTPRLQLLGGTAVQMEDELAAANVLAGAGFAGARALTATSGPGLSLMTEALGFAAAAETPMVVVDCQRPGPSTGMPTKHGQEDLWHLIHGGHGEAVRAVLAPTDVADAFAATAEAFRLAAKFRTVAFVAIDQQASLFKQTVPPFDLEAAARMQGERGSNPAASGSSAWEGTYQAYGDPGATPHRVALPGEPGGLHYSNSTEHAPNGFTNELPSVRVAMVDRRLARLAAIVEDAQDPVVVEEYGSHPAIILLSWGSTVDACREAAARLASEGVPARVVAARLLWPFPAAAMERALAVPPGAASAPGPESSSASGSAPGSASSSVSSSASWSAPVSPPPILCVEANALAQLARLVRSELPVHSRMHSLTQYDGRPIHSGTIRDRASTLAVKA